MASDSAATAATARDSISKVDTFNVLSVGSFGKEMKGKVEDVVTCYSDRYSDAQDSANPQADREVFTKKRTENAKENTNMYYDLVTDFYEYGYGHSFHFAPVYDEMPFSECVATYERGVAKSIGAKPGMVILDVGCGIGGPGREVAKFSGAKVVGFNCNAYQIQRAKEHTKKAGLDDLCSYVQGDFCNMEFEDNTFDGIFSIEATCHGKDPVAVYKEIARVLKPGGLFFDSAWTVTDTYDPQNPQHVKVKDGIIVRKHGIFGNALPELRTQQQVLTAMRTAGLEVVEFKNAHREGDWPWYHYLEGKGCCSLQSFRMSNTGRMTTHVVLSVMETCSLVPKGATKVHNVLQVAASSLIESGKLDIFTPVFRVVARKPAAAE